MTAPGSGLPRPPGHAAWEASPTAVPPRLLEAFEARGWLQPGSLAACDDDPKRAVYHFDDARRWRLRFYQLNSRALTPVFQSRSRLVGTLRDLLMGPMCHIPITRRMMLTTLVGAQRNGIPYLTIPEEEFMGFTRP